MRYAAATAAALATFAMATPVGRAYQESGHFYTVVSALQAHQPAYAPAAALQARVVGFCAQLPDLTRELDAITVRVRLAWWEQITWGLFSACWGENVHRMIGAQHFVHALTGGSHADALAALQATAATLAQQLQQNPNDMVHACALGMAMHGLGDAYAHSRLDRQDLQYPTGLGHFRDKTKPDHPLFDGERFALYKDYLQHLNRALGAELSEAQLAHIDAAGQALLQQAAAGKNYDETQLIAALRDLWGTSASYWAPYDPTVETLHQGEWVLSESCDGVVSHYATSLGTPLPCAEVWRAYWAAALPAFNAHAPATCPLTPDQELL